MDDVPMPLWVQLALNPSMYTYGSNETITWNILPQMEPYVCVDVQNLDSSWKSL